MRTSKLTGLKSNPNLAGIVIVVPELWNFIQAYHVHLGTAVKYYVQHCYA